MRHLLLPLLLVALWPVSEAFAARKWTDAQGNTIQGDYVRVHEGQVIIKKLSRGVAAVPYWSLSEEDREYVKQQLEEKGQTNLIPPEPPKNLNSGPGGLGAPGAPGLPPGVGVPGGGVGPGAGPGRPGFGPGISGPGGPGFGPGIGGPDASTPGVGPGYPGPIGPGFSPPGVSGGPSLPQPPGYTPPTSGDSSYPGPGFSPRIPGLRPGADPTAGGSGGYPGGAPGYTPPPMPEIPRMEFKYEFNCKSCGHTWSSNSIIHTGPCPSCGGNVSGGSNSNLFPASSPPPSPFSGSSSTSDSQRAARQAGAMTAVVLMIACPLVIGLIMVLAIIAVIFFVVKAVSSPAPVTVRRNY
jgi:hypothetical protein